MVIAMPRPPRLEPIDFAGLLAPEFAKRLMRPPRARITTTLNKTAMEILAVIADVGSAAEGRKLYLNDAIEALVAYVSADPRRFDDFLAWRFGVGIIPEEAPKGNDLKEEEKDVDATPAEATPST